MFIDSNSKRISIDAPYVSEEGTRYQNLRDPAVRAKLGITEIPDPVLKDPRFYYVQELEESPYVINTPKDAQTVRGLMLRQVKETAGSLLAATDWKIIRAAEGVKPVDQATLDYREAVRNASDQIEDDIQTSSTLEDLEGVNLNQWPQEV